MATVDREWYTSFNRPLSVLIVEDSTVDRRILESMLQEKDEYTSLLKAAESLEQAIVLLGEFDFEVLILDLNLPDSEGVASLKKIAERSPKTAIVVNTGAYEDELGLQTLSEGAQDFLVKGKYTSYLLNKVLHYAVERKRFEVELKEAYDKLKEAQAQLVHAEKMKVIGALASGVAHEVKNPLATILYGITFLEETLDTSKEDIQKVLSNVKDASGRADRIITDLLDFARLQQLKKEKRNINDSIEKATALAKHEFERKQIVVEKKLSDKLPLVEYDLNKIEQVLVNLMLNAVHAMDRNGVLTISSSLEKLSEDLHEIPELHRTHFSPGEKVACISIEDDGEGIDPNELEKIFEPFFTKRREDDGIGLGLSVSRNIMENHNGSITLENREQKGATARLHFKTQ